jgi:aspartyl-tRNA synthetase
MERVLIKDLKEHLNKETLLKGWVQDVRNLNKIKFIILRDRSGVMQAVAFKNETDENVFGSINDLTPESVIEIVGIPKENKESRFGIEVQIRKISLISLASVPLPIDNTDKSQTNIDKRIDYRFLDTRNINHQAVFKIRGKISRILTDFLNDNGFTNINTPKLTTVGVESGAELFKVNYFGKPAYLSQSPQIYKQMFVSGGFERVFEIAPVFRAEKSHTTRHLTEFTGVDLEMGFIDNYTDIINLIEEMFVYLINNLKVQAADELKQLNLELVVPKKVPRITMKEAKELLAKEGKKYPAGSDLDAEGEKLLGEIVLKRYKSEFVFLTEFPWEVRPFYHMKIGDKLTRSFDLLFNGVEIATGAQREHRYDILQQQAKEKGLDLESMKEYSDIFKYGIPPHGGVGFGLDRITQRLLKIENVREAVLLPRDPERLRP